MVYLHPIWPKMDQNGNKGASGREWDERRLEQDSGDEHKGNRRCQKSRLERDV